MAWTLLSIAATLGLVVLNAFFVTVEFAAVSARATRLNIAAPRNIAERAARLIKVRLDLFMSACQFGNTLAALALGAVTEPFLARVLVPVAQALQLSPTAQYAVAFVFSFAIAVSLHIVIGEQAPKNIAIAYSDQLLTILAIPLVIFTYINYPAIWLLNTLTRQVLRIAGVKPAGGVGGGLPHTEQELLALLMQSASRGAIGLGRASLLANAFEFGSLKVRQIMTPRPDVDYLLLDQPIGDLLRTVQSSAYTRLPLCDGDLDHVVGQIHMKDLFNHLKLIAGKLRILDEKSEGGQAIAIPTGMPGSAVHVIGEGQIDLRQIRRDVLFVPELMPVPRLLRLFQARRQHLAIVVDEYGSTQGIVTMEDVLEELVGQIEDEFDPISPTDVIREGSAMRFSGQFPLHKLHERIPIQPLIAGQVDTLGGYIVQQLSRWPKVGDTVELNGFQLKVLSIQKRRVGQVMVSPLAKDQSKDPGKDQK